MRGRTVVESRLSITLLQFGIIKMFRNLRIRIWGWFGGSSIKFLVAVVTGAQTTR